MTASSAPGPTNTLMRARSSIAWAQTWLLPLALGTAVVFIYLFMIVPPTDRPWYTPPKPKPGKSIVFRSLNRSHQASDEAKIKAERQARIDERRKAATAAVTAASDPPKPAAPGSVPGVVPGTPKTAKLADPSDPASPVEPEHLAPVADEAFTQPRKKAELDALWQRYGALAVDDEPIQERWAEAHKTLLFQLFSLTRDATFERAPDPPSLKLGEVRCHTLRCELQLTATYAYELHLVADALASLRRGRRSLWRTFVRSNIIAKAGDPEAKFEQTLVVGFAGDLPAPADIQLPERPLIRSYTSGPTGAATHP